MNTHTARLSSVAAALMLANIQAFAAETEARDKVLDSVVITASGFEQQIADAPASISVISGEELKKKAYRDVTDAGRFQV